MPVFGFIGILFGISTVISLYVQDHRDAAIAGVICAVLLITEIVSHGGSGE